MNKLTIEQLRNQPDFKDFREMCLAEGWKMSDPNALKMFMEERSHLNYTNDLNAPRVHEYNMHYRNSEGGYMTFEDGEKYLYSHSSIEHDEYNLYDNDGLVWKLVDEVGEYVTKNLWENWRNERTKIKV